MLRSCICLFLAAFCFAVGIADVLSGDFSFGAFTLFGAAMWLWVGWS